MSDARQLPPARKVLLSTQDPEVGEAVVDLLENIVEKLAVEPGPDSLAENDGVSDAAEEAWADDRPTPDLRYAVPPPPPDSEIDRVTHPEDLAGALVYADTSEPGEEEPRISVKSLLDVVELDAAPSSLRPTSRTSWPEPLPPPSRARFVLALSAVALAATATVVWLSRATAPMEASLTAQQAFGDALPVRQGIAARSSTPGARLIVDGKDRGPLPIMIADLPAGVHELRFDAPKHRSHSRTVKVSPGEVVDLGEIALTPAAERIRVELTPVNAYLHVVDVESGERVRFAGPWPRVIEIGPGGYDVMAFRSGFRTAAMRLWVAPGRPVTTWRIELGREDIYED